jgi:signal transduction histidine kinase
LVQIEPKRIGGNGREPMSPDDATQVDGKSLGAARESASPADPLDVILTAMVHDLCGPVARVKAVTELLHTELEAIWPETDAAHQARGWLSIIDRAATAMEEQFQVLADVTRAKSAEPLAPHVERMDLVALVCQIVDEYQAANVQRIFHVDSSLESLFGMWDHVLIRRAIDNLLGNAVKYTPHRGKIVVAIRYESDTESECGWAVVTIQDSGIGIPEQDMPHVFEMFQRGSNATASQRGAGVGLASVNDIVTQHGGTVSMTSTEGVGTSVTTRLPVEDGSPTRPTVS